MNKVAADGDVLFCVRPSAFLRGKPLLGFHAVAIERTSPDGRLREISARMLRRTPQGPELHFVSDDPRFVAAIPFPEENHPADIKIIGSIEFIVRSPTAL